MTKEQEIDLTPCDKPGELRSTPALRKRVREFCAMGDAFDLAVLAILDDLEMKLTGLRKAATKTES